MSFAFSLLGYSWEASEVCPWTIWEHQLVQLATFFWLGGRVIPSSSSLELLKLGVVTAAQSEQIRSNCLTSWPEAEVVPASARQLRKNSYEVSDLS